MSLQQQATIISIITLVLYGVVAIGLLLKRQPIRAGLAMALIAMLPLIWQALFTDSEAHGAGLLPIFLMPLPALLILGGIISTVIRAISKSQ